MILILTAGDDESADAVCARLTARGTPFTRFDPGRFGTGAGLTATAGEASIRHDGGVLDLGKVRAVWWRRPGPLSVTGFAADEWRAASDDLLDTLDRPGTLVLPGPYPVVLRAQHKMRQLILAADLGFEVPDTLVTDDPDAVLDFAGRHERMVTKRVAPGLPLTTVDGREAFRYTEVLRPADLWHVDAVRLCPVVVQQYVPKRVELRVTVVGDEVFAAAIHSQGTHHTRDDWRRYDEANTLVVPFTGLPAAEAARCVELTRRLGLTYGAIDLVLTPDGRFVFLEINPSGQYLWIEWLTQLPISDAIAERLATA